VCGPQKLAELPDRALLVDTGDVNLDDQLRGYVRVLTGSRTSTVVPVR
jgi:predicted polyphosphate/ATP-dependent NAD kinase